MIRIKSVTHHPWLFPPPLAYRVDVCLSPVEPLPMASHHLFAIFILAETIEMQVRERTNVDKINKW
jgi:hypothetical protein